MPLPDDLEKLHDLRERGALTEEEFTLAKRRLLEGAGENAKPNAGKPPEPAHSLNQLRRSNTDRWIGGVCGGLGETTGVPSWSWRILFVLAAFLHGVGLIMYALLWIFVPARIQVPQPSAVSTDR